MPAVLAALIAVGRVQKSGRARNGGTKDHVLQSCSSRSTRRAPTRSVPDAAGVETPSFNALAARGRVFVRPTRRVPETLPSHTSMHDRASIRRATACTRTRGILSAAHPVARRAAAEGRLSHGRFRLRLRARAAVRARARVRRLRRRAAAGTSRSDRPRRRPTARSPICSSRPAQPLLPLGALLRSALPRTRRRSRSARRYAEQPYLGEVAAMDKQLGRLVAAFEQQRRAARPRSSSSPITAKASAIMASRSTATCSTSRRCTCRWCLSGRASRRRRATRRSARGASFTRSSTGRASAPRTACAARERRGRARRSDEAVPRVRLAAAGHGVDGTVQGDPRRASSRPTTSAPIPREERESGRRRERSAARSRTALDDYPVPSPERRAGAAEPGRGGAPAAGEPRLRERRRGADRAQGRASSGRHGPRSSAMLEKASGLFVQRAVRGRRSRCSRKSWPRIRTISTRRCGWPLRIRRSGTSAQAMAAFKRAAAIAPRSPDVDLYLALHYARGPGVAARGAAARADRGGNAGAAAGARGAGGDSGAAGAQRRRGRRCGRKSTRCAAPRGGAGALGEMAMAAGQTAAAIDAFEKARAAEGRAFKHDLELGVLYLASRRLQDAAPRSTASRRPARTIRWRSSSARRSACCCSEPDLRGAHRRRPAARRRDDPSVDRVASGCSSTMSTATCYVLTCERAATARGTCHVAACV